MIDAAYIEARVEFELNTGCWLWAGGYAGNGYGWLSASGCVNPNHLFVGDQAANMRDAARKGRLRYCVQVGELHSRAKLTASQVAEIRSRYRRAGRYSNSRELANAYGVSTGTIRQIASGVRWSRDAQEHCHDQPHSDGKGA